MGETFPKREGHRSRSQQRADRDDADAWRSAQQRRVRESKERLAMTDDRLPLRRGTTTGGHLIEAYGDYYNPEVFIDGERTDVVDRPSLYRDGGTWEIPTARGIVTFPQRLGDENRTPRLVPDA